jgi:hypothetical protein
MDYLLSLERPVGIKELVERRFDLTLSHKDTAKQVGTLDISHLMIKYFQKV